MTMQEVIENELKCVQRDCCRLENECAKCDLVLPKEEIVNAYNEALRLEKENAELKAQIEKMKCCEICAKSKDWRNRSLCVECKKSKSHINFDIRR